MANKLTYIASGCSHAKLSFKEIYQDLELKQWVSTAFKSMQVEPNHTFGLLYNAWTETSIGKTFKENFEDFLDVLQADSGGLQVITRGLTITDEIKNNVYESQAKHSNMAMSFDEIPVSFEGKSIRGDTKNRFFDKNNFENCARSTGRNIKNQIKKFIEMDSTSNPIFIVQGNDFETYMRWTEYALNEIPEDHHKYIKGVAMGAAALGQGPLEDIQRAFFFKQLPFKTNHLHLLGVGSVIRLIPNLIFIQNGYYNEVYMTYDSTSHTSGLSYGNYYFDEKFLYFTRHYDKKIYEIIKNDICSRFDIDVTPEHLHEILNMPSKAYEAKHGNRILYIKVFIAMLLKSIINFKSHVDLCLGNKDVLRKSLGKNSALNSYMALYNVHTTDDFRHWMKHCSANVPSDSISDVRPATLKGLFG